MSEKGKPKKYAEECGSKAKVSASKVEAAAIVPLCRAIAESPEATADARAAAVSLARELEAPPTGESTVRREQMMARALGFAQRFS